MKIGQIPEPHCNYEKIFASLWEELSALDGNIAEFGVYRGGTTRQLAELTKRPVYAFDTFTGIPKEDFDETLDHDEPGKFNSGYTPEELYEGCPTIFPVVGRFEESLPKVDPSLKFVLVYIDCDLYLSAKHILDWIPPHLVNGATLVFDDYGSHKGIRKAVDEFCSQYAANATMTKTDGSSVCIVWKDN